MKRAIFTLAFAAMALFVSFPPIALADDESDETEIRITAPLEAVFCDTVPPTVTVLGLPIDITGALIELEDDGQVCDDSDGEDSDSEVEAGASQQGSGEDSDSEGGEDSDSDSDCVEVAPPPATCADLLVGESVEVTLAGDLAPFVATKVEQEQNNGEFEIQGPIQAVDPVLHTITILGMIVDISTATIEGAFDEDEDSDSDNEMGTLPVTDLIVGQFVEVELDPLFLPLLVATEVEVQNAANQCEVEVVDPNGSEVDDPEDTVQVDVEQTLKVAAASGGAKSKGKRTLHFQAQSNGSTVISGLGTGPAKIKVRRVKDGATSTGKGAITVVPNTKSTAVIRLKGSKKK